MSSDAYYMGRALDLARKGEGRTRPNPPVGAVIVREGRIVGEGFHPKAGEPHAEIFALRQAGDQARGADLYVTLEPCCHVGRTGPCADAVLAAGIARVFVGADDPNPRVAGGGIARLEAGGIEVRSGILEGECRRLIAPFARHVATGRPLVILKAGATLDGRTATSTGESQWITGEASREEVHRLRNRVDADMVGIGTVLADNPRLTTRFPEGGRDPVRIVVDARLQVPEDAAVLGDDSTAPTILATTARAPRDKSARLEARGIQILQVPEDRGRVDLAALMREVGRLGIQSLLLEGGGTLNGALLAAGLVDRVMLFFAPLLFGGDDGKGIFAGHGVTRLTEGWRLTDIRLSRFDEDILVEGEVGQCSPA
jgi:diaminohydroxyphosphoribosylaminopyrimidine deaminase/5-amino-6-(5-phosphoribosylamino)uracil reductase